ncbi:MAG: NfeD family protein [Parvularculaceae bacterium]
MQGLIDFLAAMPFWYWWVFALALLVIELGTGSTYFLWPAIAAFAAGLFDLGPLDGQWQLQLIVFAAVTIFLSVYAPPKVRPWLHRKYRPIILMFKRTRRTENRALRGKVGYGVEKRMPAKCASATRCGSPKAWLARTSPPAQRLRSRAPKNEAVRKGRRLNSPLMRG